MAWTHVRYGRGSYVSAASGNNPRRIRSLPVEAWLSGAEKYLVAFIGIQMAQFGLLWQGGAFDPALAICQSASLFAVACLFAKHRPSPSQAPFVTPSDIEIEPLNEALLVVPVAQCTPHACAKPGAIAIDEQSQTWADLMARISHEIRTPLNAVIGFSDLMEREIFGPLGNDRYRDYLAHIRDSGEALLKSAEDTLALSALLAIPAQGQRSQCSALAQLTQDAWILVEPLAARRGVCLEADIAGTLEVAGDRRALRQALANLLMEAAQRAAPNTTIEIKAWANSDTVRLKILSSEAERQRRPLEPSLEMCVARALLELQGTSLKATECTRRSRWQATTVLDLALQPDFFTAIERSHTGAFAR